MQVTRKPAYPTPFEGRPARMPLLGLFCVAPDVYWKLFVVSPKEQFQAMGLGNHCRRMRRWKNRPPSDAAAAPTLNDVLDAVDQAEMSEASLAFLEEMKAAVSGNVEAKSRVNELGIFHMTFLGLGYGREDWRFVTDS